MLSCTGEPSGEVASSSGTRTGWCRTRSASGRPRWPRAAPSRAPPTCGRRPPTRPLLSNGWPQHSSASALRIDDVESAPSEQALATVGQRLGRRRRAARPCCARRSSGSRRRARHASTAARRDGTKCIGRGSAGDHFGSRAARERCACRRARPSSPSCRRRRAAGRRSPSPTRTPPVTRAVVVGDDVGDALRQRARAPSAQRLDEQPGLDADRTRRRAQAAAGAGVDAVVVVERAAARRALGVAPVGVEARDLAPADDALPRRQRQPARRALGLAEAALDARVDERIAAGSGFRFLRCASRSSLRIDAGVEQAVRIEQRA